MLHISHICLLHVYAEEAARVVGRASHRLARGRRESSAGRRSACGVSPRRKTGRGRACARPAGAGSGSAGRADPPGRCRASARCGRHPTARQGARPEDQSWWLVSSEIEASASGPDQLSARRPVASPSGSFRQGRSEYVRAPVGDGRVGAAETPACGVQRAPRRCRSKER